MFQKHNGRYCIDFSQFHDTKTMMDMPRCSAKDWRDRCEDDVDGVLTNTNNEIDCPISFQSRMRRSSSYTALQPSLRMGFLPVGKTRKRSRDVALPRGAESGQSRVRSSSCTALALQVSPSPPRSRRPLTPIASSSIALYQAESPVGSETPDSVDSGISSTSLRPLNEDGGGVLFQLEDIVEDGPCGLGSTNDLSVV